MQGADSSWTINNESADGFRIGGSSTSGELLVLSGGKVTGGAAEVVGNGGSAQVTVAGPGAQWHVHGPLHVEGASAAITLAGDGVIEVTDGPLSLSRGARVNLFGGTLNMNGNEVQLTDGGDMTFVVGELRGVTRFLGDLDQFGGTLSVGPSVAGMRIEGDYLHGPGATLKLQLGGADSGTLSQPLLTTHNATLSGRLEVSLAENGDGTHFIPAIGGTL